MSPSRRTAIPCSSPGQSCKGNELKHSKIYFCAGGEGAWGAANEVQGINGDYIVKDPVVGELFGREVLFFTSNMPGGYGGYDIYYATRTGDGAYDDPVNLGEVINTVGRRRNTILL